jgi:hypothetical protein
VAPGVIDENSAHHLRRDAKEMRAALPIDVPLVDKPQVYLVNQGRWLQGVVGALFPKLPRRNAAEFRVHEGQQLVEGSLAPATPITE